MSKITKMAIAIAPIFVIFLVSPGNATSTQECGYTQVDYNPNPREILTREETLAEMDLAFQNSLTRFGQCQNNQNVDVSSSTDSSANTADIADSQNQEIESIAATGISGTEKPVEVVEPIVQASAVPNGAIPQDIPNGDNDTIFQEQVRGIAIAETDPVYQALLWNEYRKAKGLPQIR